MEMQTKAKARLNTVTRKSRIDHKRKNMSQYTKHKIFIFKQFKQQNCRK